MFSYKLNPTPYSLILHEPRMHHTHLHVHVCTHKTTAMCSIAYPSHQNVPGYWYIYLQLQCAWTWEPTKKKKNWRLHCLVTIGFKAITVPLHILNTKSKVNSNTNFNVLCIPDVAHEVTHKHSFKVGWCRLHAHDACDVYECRNVQATQWEIWWILHCINQCLINRDIGYTTLLNRVDL